MSATLPAAVRDDVGPLELLVVQPTPFCNLDCSYCYLPNRGDKRRMSISTLDSAFRWVEESGLVREPFTLLWHAGEPLIVPVEWYEAAAELLQKRSADWQVTQSFQTNATLIDAQWCRYFRRHEIDVGVSVDGPAFLHDRHRRTRQGRGTLQRVLRGIHTLHEHEIPFKVITVLTADSLDYPDELFDFYRAHGVQCVGFNPEEVEGPNTVSSLQEESTVARFRRFLARFLELALAADPPMQVREFEQSATALLYARRSGPPRRTQENRPFGIVNVDCEGNFSTYSPELLGLESSRYGSFALGKVATSSLADVLASSRFARMEADIAEGVRMCRESCRYFPFCGGGPPGNKHFENGTFVSTETLFCRLHMKACLDVTADWLEHHPPACAGNEPERAAK
ncbi:MAG: GRRM system radical SAM/SPASM domain protein [Planctomycetia bacterium]|nr:GRRM system radical SAM/SPASM domain protein [Planctomycetia bacterium]